MTFFRDFVDHETEYRFLYIGNLSRFLPSNLPQIWRHTIYRSFDWDRQSCVRTGDKLLHFRQMLFTKLLYRISERNGMQLQNKPIDARNLECVRMSRSSQNNRHYHMHFSFQKFNQLLLLTYFTEIVTTKFFLWAKLKFAQSRPITCHMIHLAYLAYPAYLA